MADPTPYAPGYDFTSVEKGPQFNAELADVALATEELVDAVKDIRRSDGALQNGVVTYDAISTTLINEIVATSTAASITSASASAASASASAASATASAGSATASAGSATASASSAAAALASADRIDLGSFDADVAATSAQRALAETARTGAETAKAGADVAKTAAELAETNAETARDAAFVNANVYADTAAGLAAVALNGQFQVVSGDEVIRYREDAGPVATEVARYPGTSAVSKMESRVSGIAGTLVETVGRSASPVTGLSYPASYTVIFETPVKRTGRIKKIRLFAVAATTVAVRVFRVSSANLVQVGADITLTCATGLNEFNADLGGFSATDITKGDYVGFYTAGNIATTTIAVDRIGFISGNVTSTTVSSVSSNFGNRLAFGVDIEATEFLEKDDIETSTRRSFSLGSEKVQAIGRAGPPVTGTASGNGTYIIDTPAAGDGVVSSFSLWSLGAGTLELLVYDMVGQAFCISNAISLSVASGLNSFSRLSGTLPELVLQKGQYLGVRHGSLMAVNTSTPGFLYRYDPRRNLLPIGVNFAGTRVEMNAEISYFQLEAAKILRLTQAQYDALSTKDPFTLYAII